MRVGGSRPRPRHCRARCAEMIALRAPGESRWGRESTKPQNGTEWLGASAVPREAGAPSGKAALLARQAPGVNPIGDCALARATSIRIACEYRKRSLLTVARKGEAARRHTLSRRAASSLQKESPHSRRSLHASSSPRHGQLLIRQTGSVFCSRSRAGVSRSGQQAFARVRASLHGLVRLAPLPALCEHGREDRSNDPGCRDGQAGP
jgi:hypothetical protein